MVCLNIKFLGNDDGVGGEELLEVGNDRDEVFGLEIGGDGFGE